MHHADCRPGNKVFLHNTLVIDESIEVYVRVGRSILVEERGTSLFTLFVFSDSQLVQRPAGGGSDIPIFRVELFTDAFKLNAVALVHSVFVLLVLIIEVQVFGNVKVELVGRILLGLFGISFENHLNSASTRNPPMCNVLNSNLDFLIRILPTINIKVDFIVENVVMNWTGDEVIQRIRVRFNIRVIKATQDISGCSKRTWITPF